MKKKVKSRASLRNKLKELDKEKIQFWKFTGNGIHTNPHKRELKAIRKELKRNGEYSAKAFREQYGEI